MPLQPTISRKPEAACFWDFIRFPPRRGESEPERAEKFKPHPLVLSLTEPGHRLALQSPGVKLDIFDIPCMSAQNLFLLFRCDTRVAAFLFDPYERSTKQFVSDGLVSGFQAVLQCGSRPGRCITVVPQLSDVAWEYVIKTALAKERPPPTEESRRAYRKLAEMMPKATAVALAERMGVRTTFCKAVLSSVFDDEAWPVDLTPSSQA